MIQEEDNNLPNDITNLSDMEQHILNRLLGECLPIQEIAHELQLSEDTILKLADGLWLDLSINTRQQFIRFWQQHI